MNALRCTLLLSLLLVACTTEVVELFPGDLGSDDLAQIDLNAPDLATSCVCRFSRCRTSTDCASFVAPTSTCDNTFLCSGAVSTATATCRIDSDCDTLGGGAGSWTCTTGPATTNACP